MLSTNALSFAYPGQPELNFADFECRQGEHWLVLGQSGSGKTTLLHLLAGMLTPTSGSVILAGTNISRLSGKAVDKFRGGHIGIIFQRSHFIKSLTVEENLLLAQQLAGFPVDRSKVSGLLERLNIVHKLKSRPDRLSVGEQQRVAIARSLVNTPKIILADEPTSALDDLNCEYVTQLLEQQAMEMNATLLIVTHDGRLRNRISNQIHLN
ncbi:MAG TPA: ABC transporter ATP-binding protein [Flavilitoribacter sp.]|nr:ABC transporter ATP-binding protein [Flavilitoribacter sp.]HMQ86089.1 ABC transporter ATP-binding protein [Flavilitoribacter sp.]